MAGFSFMGLLKLFPIPPFRQNILRFKGDN